jgi:hypothetical protein
VTGRRPARRSECGDDALALVPRCAGPRRRRSPRRAGADWQQASSSPQRRP